MIRHIVFFKLKPFANETERMFAIQTVIKHLNELPVKIDLIRDYHAGADVRKLDWSYDIGLQMDFDSMDALEAYTVHPAHQDFVSFNKSYSEQKVCIDFEI